MQRINVVRIQMVKDKTLSVGSKKIGSPSDASEILKDYLKGADREYMVVMALDTKNKVNAISTVSMGTVNASIAHPREVFKVLIEANATSFIVGHNHPSGDPTPSQEDINITKRLSETGKVIGIDLLDHIIIGDDDYISLKEKGIL